MVILTNKIRQSITPHAQENKIRQSVTRKENPPKRITQSIKNNPLVHTYAYDYFFNCDIYLPHQNTQHS